jgi:ABC-2 type transport system permease protein
MSTLTGTAHLLRLIARVDRIRLTVWALVLGFVPVGVASSFATLYETEASRQGLVATIASAPGLVALLGPVNGTSIGALTAWRVGTIGAVLVALMAAFTIIRHTRLEEETGRRELLGSTVMGRHAPVLAAALITLATGTVIGALLTGGLIGLGESASGAVAFGLSWALVATVFVGVGALAAQLTESAGGARAIAGSAIGLFFALRLAGDGGAANGVGWLSWLSPIGWVNKLEPYGEERWWVIALFIAIALLIGSVALVLSSQRDVGAGYFPPRPGPGTAAPLLSSPIGLAWRLHRGAVIGWSIAIALFATIWGGLADTVGKLFEDNPQLAEIFEAMGGAGTLTDIFFAAAMGIVALIVSAYAIDAALTLRSEEDGLRAEPILATPTPRLRWATSHVLFAVVVPIFIMTLAGVTAGLTYGTMSGEIARQIGDLVEAALLQVPAIWVAGGVAVALYGLAPRRTSLSWAALVGFLLVGQLGQILQFPQWVLNLSPFTHVPAPPEPVTLVPLLALTAIAALLVGIGLIGFGRRDVL